MAKKRTNKEAHLDAAGPLPRAEVDAAAKARQARSAFCPDLVPIFMMIETDLFRALNEKAARRNVSYDAMMRMIIREQLCKYE